MSRDLLSMLITATINMIECQKNLGVFAAASAAASISFYYNQAPRAPQLLVSANRAGNGTPLYAFVLLIPRPSPCIEFFFVLRRYPDPVLFGSLKLLLFILRVG